MENRERQHATDTGTIRGIDAIPRPYTHTHIVCYLLQTVRGRVTVRQSDARTTQWSKGHKRVKRGEMERWRKLEVAVNKEADWPMMWLFLVYPSGLKRHVAPLTFVC